MGVNLSSLYYKPKVLSDDVTLMNEIKDLHNRYPFMGYRRITVLLSHAGYETNRKRVLRIMRILEIQAIYPKRNLSKRRQEDVVYPYLLTEYKPVKPNDAWSIDITYIKMQGGFIYLVALIDIVSRMIIGWCLSPYLETESCLEAFNMAIVLAVPTIINSDQGCQFTSKKWVEKMQEYQILISMDSKGAWLDNVWIERFWRSIKYEEVYLKSYDSIAEATQSIAQYIEFYNHKRPHQALGYKTPAQVYLTLKRSDINNI
ncbi:Integrase catalytic subunit [endosymbiont of Acanthamoeba sp. UWC8]|nr:Integrase catalytic subunit [endosymbiont of Acanthamoeba sp. UWC8]AIF81443.1 Integrase catalytic subunit [endosymbiont of Acanthamoeba sp. UWC8]